ncbi:thiopeptide-type bacteriocin biosynthesis protein [Pedobacter sp. WC2423]|uniref:lantibiotic dehydratase n=1 Tax=Pedobacter sp. WC2423 TaxID=3234142 RepID=UPI003466C7C4
MSEFIVDPFLLVRSPAYSYENFNESFLQQALTTDFFRASLFFASQTLYIELKKKNFDYTQFNEQVKTTLWKYLNRMCFRPLPYGLFSSFSLAKWTAEKGNNLLFSGKGELKALPDFVAVLDYVSKLKPEELSAIQYLPNNSMYTVAGELYFVNQDYTEQDKHTIIHLKVIPGMKGLLKFIDQGQTKGAIINYLVKQYGEDAGIYDYFDHLVNGGVIVSELIPNVTGKSYNERCMGLLKEYAQLDLKGINTFSMPINDQNDVLPRLNKHIEEILGRNEKNVPYSLYEREISGGLNKEIHSVFISLIKNLNKLTKDKNEEAMLVFKNSFIKRYDQQEVGLMEVIDPGAGIGYDNLASAFGNQNNEFVDDLFRNKDSVNTVKWGEAERLLFEKWNNISRSGTDKILLTQEDLNLLPESKSVLPPGMSILYKNVDQELWIDQAGGISGIEAGARFGISNSEIDHQLKDICQQEMAINHDFIFAEIAFSPANRTSNINQRGHFYPYEIPVLTHPGRPAENTIKLNDLVISVREHTILLRSVKLNKYIIPRLSSAYNSQLATIPVFRFLCDLQYQGIKASLSFSLKDIFPGMSFYPRVQLNHAVISPATWILDRDKISKIVAQNLDFWKELALPAYFSLNERDNFLVFNSTHKDDLDLFRKCIKNKESVILKEYVFSADAADLQDKKKQPYATQYIACIINQSKSYILPQSNSKIIGDIKKLKVRRTFFPGDEWLYLKLYAHDSLGDNILMNIVSPVIRKYKKKDPAFKWFFIRYNDTGHHIRLRFFIHKELAHHLLLELNTRLKPLCNSGKVSEIVLDTYQRELERYSTELINEVESLFYYDSEYILSAFKTGELNARFKLSFAVHSALLMVKCFIKDKNQRFDFFNKVLSGFSKEFSNKDKLISRKLDLKYRNFQKELIESKQLYARDVNNFYQLLNTLNVKISHWRTEDKYDLISSLIHMHMNRIFESQPREYECLAYHFMNKHQAYLNYTANDEF